MRDDSMVMSPTLSGHADPLDEGNIAALVAGKHGAPFDVLGPHSLTLGGERVWIVRTFQPGAEAVSLVPSPTAAQHDDGVAEALSMRQLHAGGLFSVVLESEPPTAYALDVHYPFGYTRSIFDPYAFPPVLSDYDLYLIGEGTHL